MIKIILFAGVFLVLSAKFPESKGNISLESCSLSCDQNEDHVRNVIGARDRLQGPPGKRGPVGQKGERGIKGDIGGKGNTGANGDIGAKGESGVKGQRGIKGDNGVEGQSGPRGIPGSSCDCSRYGELATQVATLQQQLNDLRDDVKYAAVGWTKASNNRWYKFVGHEKVSYSTAKSRCEGFGGRLVSSGMRSASLRNEIKRLLPNPRGHTWIGLDDLTSEGNYVWSDGVSSTLQNTDWNSGQPDRSNERCAALASTHGKVFDDSCSTTYNYLCEY